MSQEPENSGPDNLVLQMLREIRAELAEQKKILAEHSRFHEEHRQAFAELRDELKQVNQNAIYAIGLGTLGHRDSETTKDRVAGLETRVRRLEEQRDQT